MAAPSGNCFDPARGQADRVAQQMRPRVHVHAISPRTQGAHRAVPLCFVVLFESKVAGEAGQAVRLECERRRLLIRCRGMGVQRSAKLLAVSFHH